MVSFECQECNRSFTAISKEEAEAEYKKQWAAGNTQAKTFSHAIDIGEVAYARFCAYCGSVAITQQ